MSLCSIDSSIENIQKLISDLNEICSTDTTDKQSEVLSLEEYRPERKRKKLTKGKHFKRKRVYNPKILGRNEEEFYKTKFKALLKRYLPENYSLDKLNIGSVTTYSFNQNFSLSCTSQNCGYCFKLKTAALIMLFICCIIFIFDPCCVDRSDTDSSNIINKLRSTQIEWKRHLKRAEPTNTSTVNDNVTVKPILKEYCGFKIFLLIWIIVGIGLYIFLFWIYSCHIIINQNNFPWILTESILMFVYSFTLFICSLVAYSFRYKNFGSTMCKAFTFFL